jgi:hypothetical protein
MYDATTSKVPGFIGFIPAHLARKWIDKSSDELKKAITDQVDFAVWFSLFSSTLPF